MQRLYARILHLSTITGRATATVEMPQTFTFYFFGSRSGATLASGSGGMIASSVLGSR